MTDRGAALIARAYLSVLADYPPPSVSARDVEGIRVLLADDHAFLVPIAIAFAAKLETYERSQAARAEHLTETEAAQ